MDLLWSEDRREINPQKRIYSKGSKNNKNITDDERDRTYEEMT